MRKKYIGLEQIKRKKNVAFLGRKKETRLHEPIKRKQRTSQEGTLWHSNIHVLGTTEVAFWKGKRSFTQHEKKKKAHEHEITTSSGAVEKKLRSKAHNDGTLSVYFLYYVVYSFNYV